MLLGLKVVPLLANLITV
nr:hypothetical protein [Clostridium sp. AM16-23]